MTSTLRKNKAPGTGWPAGAGTADAAGSQESREPSPSSTGLGAPEPALALHMSLPGTRLDVVLGGPHPMLVELVRHLARMAARADHVGTQPILNSDDTTQEDL